jgi:hypothetical protein
MTDHFTGSVQALINVAGLKKIINTQWNIYL